MSGPTTDHASRCPGRVIEAANWWRDHREVSPRPSIEQLGRAFGLCGPEAIEALRFATPGGTDGS
jgi:hypothetical protein